MVTILGRAITRARAMATKQISTKAAKNLAKEVGENLVRESQNVGRNLSNPEINTILGETLPKRIVPKLLSTENDMYSEISKRNGGINKRFDLEDFNYSFKVSSAAINIGENKYPLYANTYNSGQDLVSGNAQLAHDLELVLQGNNTISGLIHRKFFEPIQRLYEADFFHYVNQRLLPNKKIQTALSKNQENLSIHPIKKVEEVIRKLANDLSIIIQSDINALKSERDAYEVGKHVEKYASRELGIKNFSKIQSSIYDFIQSLSE